MQAIADHAFKRLNLAIIGPISLKELKKIQRVLKSVAMFWIRATLAFETSQHEDT